MTTGFRELDTIGKIFFFVVWVRVLWSIFAVLIN